MGWDGSGNVTRSNGTNTGGTVWQDDKSADIKIRADLHDTHDQDLADALEACLNRNGENAMAANLKMGGYKLVNAGEGTAADEMATVGQAQRNTLSVAQAAGTDALTASYSPAIPSLEDKLTLYVRANAANTSTTPTFSPNGLAAKTIVKNGNEALIAGDIFGQYHVLILQYRLTDDVWELLNPATFEARFPNVNADVTASDEDLNKTTDHLLTGEVKMYGGSTAPSGWLFCNGQAVSRTTYADLYGVVGTTYGAGDGSTTFNLPDLRDRSPLGTATMGTTDAARVSNYTTALGDSGGEDEHTLTDAEMPSHNHSGSTGNSSPFVENEFNGNILAHEESGGSSTRWAVNGTLSGTTGGNADARVRSHAHSISSAGGDSAHNTMHPFLALNFIIKT